MDKIRGLEKIMSETEDPNYSDKLDRLEELVNKNSGFITGTLNKGLMKYMRWRENPENNNKILNKIDKVPFPLHPGKFLAVYIGGSINEKDQEIYAEILNERPWRVTTKHTFLSPLLSLPNLGIDYLIMPSGYSALYLMAIGTDAFRLFRAEKFNKPMAAVSLKSLIINTPSYAKRLKQKLFG
tara:strand:- start:63 stop:611 length:549 start_codon:yes stop_codon:yes gene_type:complete